MIIAKQYLKHGSDIIPNFNKSNKSIVTADVPKANYLRDPKVVEKFLLHVRRLCDSNVTEVLNVKAHRKTTDSCKQYNKEIYLSSLKLNNLTLNDVTASTSDTEDKQREIGLTFQESHEQTDKLIEFYSRNKNTTSNASENDALRNNPFLKLKMTSSDHIPLIKIPGTSGQKPNEDALKEIDLERERSEVNNVLRKILVLGHPK
ncbi:hypothetical protein TNCT_273591 [Trichonephila clavata]|uniref:Uncharacterized protein n=1 Tax=Trichonephila clavata TaxID=2740835 RepID=A0A8X6EZS7_TRICU|nr:hypothetical protein TNCT_273591 [Trichonephila clavata]